jgi:hypothetical protein
MVAADFCNELHCRHDTRLRPGVLFFVVPSLLGTLFVVEVKSVPSKLGTTRAKTRLQLRCSAACPAPNRC